MLGRSVGHTDPGRRRRRNEDAYVVQPPLFAVADGMGGAQAGEIASELAARAVGEGGAGEAGGERRVVALIQEANRRVYEAAGADASRSGMGTTMTVALVEGSRVSIGHVGDSRAYLVRDGSLEQLTDDHSLVAELVRSGKLSPEEAESHPQRSVITRALGTDPDVDVDAFTVDGRKDDLFLLCSDGLTSMLEDAEILRIAERHRGDLDALAKGLIKAANGQGGEDNITVVAFEIAEGAGDTETMPAAAPPEQDEDTLSGLEAMPPAEPAALPDEWGSQDGREQVAPQRPVAARPPRPRRRRGMRAGALAAVAAAVLVGLTLWGLSAAHFVGADDDGRVAVYQGFPYDLGGDVRLYRAVYVSPLLAAQLSQEERRALFDHDLRGRDSAVRAVKDLEQDIVP